MTNKQQQIPAIRFNGFTDTWEQRKLGEVGSVVMCKRIFKDQTTAFGDIPFYKIGTFGGNPDSFIPNELFEEYKKNYPYPEIGDILMSASGTIGRTVVYEGEKAYYQDSNIVWLKTDKSLIDNSFLKQFYQVVKWSGLEGSTIKRLYNSNILSTGINLPSLKEQTKLGTFFNQLDNTIALHQRQLDNYKELKNSMLQKMLPQDGKTVPKVRFPGFTVVWKHCKLSNLYEKGGSGGTPKSTNKSYYMGDIPFLGISDISASNGYVYDTEKHISEEGLKNSSAWIVPKEAISLAMYASVGKVAILKTDAATSQAFYNMVFKNMATRNFVFQYLLKKESTNGWSRLVSTGTQSNLNAQKVRELEIMIPSIEEQEKIGTFFKQLDDTIAFHQQRVNGYQEFKKVMLQQMFV